MSCGAAADRQVELLHADVQNRRRDDQPGQRPGDADVENLLAIGPHAVHADHRAHRADEAERHGNAQRVAGRDAVAHRLQKVPHLVRQQNRQHGAHVRQPLLPMLGDRCCCIPPVESIACGRQLAAPTQNVERHVAMNSMSGSVTRRRGRRS